MNVQLPEPDQGWSIIWGIVVFIAGGLLLAGKQFIKGFMNGEQPDKRIVLEKGTIANMQPVREIVEKLDKLVMTNDTLNVLVGKLVVLIGDAIEERKDEAEIQRRVELGVEKELKKGDAAYKRATRPERERP